MDFDTYLRFVFALVFVLALIAVIGWAARRYGMFGVAARPRGANRRLQVVEIAPVDAKRKLVLIRRDTTEHLLLLGAGSEMLVEASIVPPVASARPGADAAE